MSNVNEIWRKIAGYENYSVSNLGNVRNDKTGKILKPRLNGRGYYHVSLCKNNVAKTVRIHKIVANTFIPNPNNLPCVNHLSENKLDNRVDNLAWCTWKDNLNWGSAQQKKAESRKNGAVTINGVTYKSKQEAIRQTGLSIYQMQKAGYIKTA